MTWPEIPYADTDLVALSEIEHFAYCPRQWALISTEQVWADNVSTARGTLAHGRADETNTPREGHPGARGLTVWSDQHGLLGRAAVVELQRDMAPVPVEYKSGHRMASAVNLQLTAQALCLEEMFGQSVAKGAIWLSGRRRRLEVEIDKNLRVRFSTSRPPSGWVEWRRCFRRPIRSSVRGLLADQRCLPQLVSDPRRVDIMHGMLFSAPGRPRRQASNVRELLNTLYVQTPGTWLMLDHDSVIARVADEPLRRVPLRRLQGIAVFGPVSVSTPLVLRCGQDGIALAWFTSSGRFRCSLRAPTTGNVLLRQAQYAAHDHAGQRLDLARTIVAGKLVNASRFARHGARLVHDSGDAVALRSSATLIDSMRLTLPDAEDLDTVRGIEGQASKRHFENIRRCLIVDLGFEAALSPSTALTV